MFVRLLCGRKAGRQLREERRELRSPVIYLFVPVPFSQLCLTQVAEVRKLVALHVMSQYQTIADERPRLFRMSQW